MPHAADRAGGEHALLLREVHHRVKNNLQVMASLMNLEAGRASHPEVKRIVRILQDRLRAVALVHDQLHRSPALTHVDLRAYAAAVLQGLSMAHGLESAGIQLRLRSSVRAAGMNDALRVGLILNELVSNAVVHGFGGADGARPGPARPGSRISVSVTQRSDRRLLVRVSNTGAPLPATFVPPADRLGLIIVSNIARNSGGRFWWSRRGGASFHVELRQS